MHFYLVQYIQSPLKLCLIIHITSQSRCFLKQYFYHMKNKIFINLCLFILITANSLCRLLVRKLLICVNVFYYFRLLQMGCYGLGITRIIAACIEQLSVDENIRLPLLLAPFLLSVIIPKVIIIIMHYTS